MNYPSGGVSRGNERLSVEEEGGLLTRVLMCVSPVPADEHFTPGKHWHAELSTSAPLHQDLPGTPGAASIPWLPQRPQVGAAHLDFQPERYPHGPRREGAPLHGLTPLAAALTAC